MADLGTAPRVIRRADSLKRLTGGPGGHHKRCIRRRYAPISCRVHLRSAGVTAPVELERAVEDVLTQLRSRASLGIAISKAPTVPAGRARAVQTAENVWREIEEEFGFLTTNTRNSAATAQAASTPAPSRSKATGTAPPCQRA